MKKKLAATLMITVLTTGMAMPVMAACYPDVNEGEWYYGYVQYVSDKGCMSGYDSGYFGPADNITREQLVTMMYRYTTSIGGSTMEWADLDTYPDSGAVSGFAKDSMSWAIGRGLIQGDQGNINPQGKASRAQCAAILERYLENAGETGGSTEAPSTPDGHTHNWVEQTRTVHHDAVGHSEQYLVKAAWDEEVTEEIYDPWECCNVCGADCTADPAGHEEAHALAYEGGGWHSEYYKTVTKTVHHDAEYGTRWVEDKAAYDEVVVDGYQCSDCGATK